MVRSWKMRSRPAISTTNFEGSSVHLDSDDANFANYDVHNKRHIQANYSVFWGGLLS